MRAAASSRAWAARICCTQMSMSKSQESLLSAVSVSSRSASSKLTSRGGLMITSHFPSSAAQRSYGPRRSAHLDHGRPPLSTYRPQLSSTSKPHSRLLSLENPLAILPDSECPKLHLRSLAARIFHDAKVE